MERYVAVVIEEELRVVDDSQQAAAARAEQVVEPMQSTLRHGRPVGEPHTSGLWCVRVRAVRVCARVCARARACARAVVPCSTFL